MTLMKKLQMAQFLPYQCVHALWAVTNVASVVHHYSNDAIMITSSSCLLLARSLSDFGHFISLDEMNSTFYLMDNKKNSFSNFCLLAAA